MKTLDFLNLVKRPRESQKAYFRKRDPQSLEKAKAVEREVDNAIIEIDAHLLRKKEPELFDKKKREAAETIKIMED